MIKLKVCVSCQLLVVANQATSSLTSHPSVCPMAVLVGAVSAGLTVKLVLTWLPWWCGKFYCNSVCWVSYLGNGVAKTALLPHPTGRNFTTVLARAHQCERAETFLIFYPLLFTAVGHLAVNCNLRSHFRYGH